MTTGPEFRREWRKLLPALAAVGLFVVMAAMFVGAPIGSAAGFPQDAEVANESLGDASVASNASVQAENGSTVAVVETADGNESTTLSDRTGVNATILTAGGNTYAVVSEPVSITESIGYAMFGLTDQMPTDLGSESFLAVFEVIDLVLVAALVGSIMLARRESAETTVALFTSEEVAAPDAEPVAADGGTEDADDGGDA